MVRSFLAWALPWLVVAVVVAGAVWVAVDTVGGDEAAAPSAPSPTPTETPLEEPTTQPTPVETSKGADDPLVSYEGITAQVLNATGGVEGAAQRMADRLAKLGFDIVAIDTALGAFETTTVYWGSPQVRDVAETLAADNGWVAAKKPDDLSSDVQLHVIVGKDEAG